MKGYVSRRGKTWAFWFDIDPDPLTGKRRQQTRSGFKSEKEAWQECRTLDLWVMSYTTHASGVSYVPAHLADQAKVSLDVGRVSLCLPRPTAFR
jgi:hypothetical protein